MIHSFKQHISEATDQEVVISFGRFNPPTNGHEKLLDKVFSVANKSKHRIYPSQTEDKKKNPLSFKDKVKFMRKMFPKHARHIMSDKSVKTIFHAVSKAYDDGFIKCTLVVGSDRVEEFKTTLNKYNGVKGRHGFYEFADGINVISAGERDPDSDDVSGMSASKLRAAAKENDLITFSKGMPSSFKDAKGLMNAVRKGMGLTESGDFKQHFNYKRTSYIREKYVSGDLFNVGDKVTITETRESAVIKTLSANHVGVLVNNELKNVWLSDIVRSSK